jgi:penicillin-binding protein activator
LACSYSGRTCGRPSRAGVIVYCDQKWVNLLICKIKAGMRSILGPQACGQEGIQMIRWTTTCRVLLLIATAVLFMIGCASRKQVTRIPVDSTTDLSGRWNDTDSREVSDELIRDCLSGNWILEHATANGRRPVVIVGKIRNETLEHIPTGTFVADLERAMVNSGKVDVVATAAERGALRAEKEDQWENASEETAKRLGRERGADYMLMGSVQSIEDREGGMKVVFYQVDMTMTNIETNQKAWIGQKKIKKEIKQSKYAP